MTRFTPGSTTAPGARGDAPRGAWALTPDRWLVVLVVIVAIVLRVWSLGGGSHDYDEGVYWQSLRAMAAGKPLYSAIFASQPPLFPLLLYPIYIAFGQSLVAARLAIVLYSLLGLGAVYGIGRLLCGRWIGLIALTLLATDPLYLRESYTLQAEVPALALALASVACALLALRSAGIRRRWLAALAGLILAFACGAKLFDVVAVLPVVLYLLAPAGEQLVDQAGSIHWPGAAAMLAALRRALPDLTACGAGLVAGAGIVMLPFAGQWPAMYDQAVRFHEVAGRVLDAGMEYNIGLVANVQSELPLEILAVLAVVCALLRRHWAIVAPVLWALASLVLLLRQQPLFAHHVALLVPPLVVCVAVALPDVIAVAESMLRPQSTDSRVPLPRLLVWVLLGFVVVFGVLAGGSALGAAATVSRADARAAQIVAAVTRPGDLVVADDQFIVGLADRDVPPQLVDTSEVRIFSGYLTLSQLERAVQDPRVTAVLFYSGRFDRVAGFRSWMTQHYVLVGTFGGNTALYLKAPPPIAPV